MANRTVQIIGQGFGSTPASVTATFNGSQVFSGSVSTINQPVPSMPIDPSLVNSGTVLFTFEIPMNLSGNVPMTVNVDGSMVFFAQIYANYANVANISAGNLNGFVSSGANSFVNIYNPYPAPVNFECRSNVTLNGQSMVITPEERGTLDGPWWWQVTPGSALTCDVEITAGLE